MVWKENNKIEVEEQENKIDVKILNKKTNAKTFAGWLIGKTKQARNENNPEVMHLLTSIYEKYMELEKRRLQPVIELEIIEGWGFARQLSPARE